MFDNKGFAPPPRVGDPEAKTADEKDTPIGPDTGDPAELADFLSRNDFRSRLKA